MINFNFIGKILSLKSFKDMLLSRIMRAFDLNFNETNDSFKFTTKVNPKAIEALKLREIILSEKTISRLQGNLKMELLESLNLNESITEVIKRLNPLFTDMMPFEIERIARNEILYAQQEGVYQSHKSSGVAKYKIWKANLKNPRTAADSKRLHNQIQPIDSEFIDYKTGKACMHSPNRPNCRCTIHYLVELPKNIEKKNGQMYLVD